MISSGLTQIQEDAIFDWISSTITIPVSILWAYPEVVIDQHQDYVILDVISKAQSEHSPQSEYNGTTEIQKKIYHNDFILAVKFLFNTANTIPSDLIFKSTFRDTVIENLKAAGLVIRNLIRQHFLPEFLNTKAKYHFIMDFAMSYGSIDEYTVKRIDKVKVDGDLSGNITNFIIGD